MTKGSSHNNWGRHNARSENVAAGVKSLTGWSQRLLADIYHGGASDRTEELHDTRALLAEHLPDIEIVELLDSGGQGVVFEAYQKSAKRMIAIKFMSSDAASLPSARKRFDREFEYAARLRHPYIVSPIGRGEVCHRPYFTMERIYGISIDDHQLIERLNVRDLIALFIKVCEAVNYAHQRGIIHRDLKPRNILIDGEGQPRLLDFGLAKIVEERGAESDLTAPGAAIGTMHYMAPEQLGGSDGEVDARTDVYALGVALYRLLVGDSPYPLERSYSKNIWTVLNEPPIPLGKVVPDEEGEGSPDLRSNDVELNAILQKALAKTKEDRYQSAAALGDDLRNYLDGKVIDALSDQRRYMARKFLSQYRLPVAAMAAVFIAVTVSLFVYWHFSRKYEGQRDIARAVGRMAQSRFHTLLDKAFPAASGMVGSGAVDPKLLEALALTQASMVQLLGEDDELADLNALILEEYGDWERLRGNRTEAEQHYASMLQVIETIDPATLSCSTLGSMHIRGLRKLALVADQPQSHLDEALKVVDQYAQCNSEASIATEAIGVHLDYAKRLFLDAEFEKARQHLERTFGLLSAPSLSAADETWLWSQSCRAHALRGDIEERLGQLSQAIDYHRTAVELANRLVEQEPTNVTYRSLRVTAWYDLGQSYMNQAKYGEAEALFEDAIAESRHMLWLDDTSIEWWRHLYIAIERYVGLCLTLHRYEDAERLISESAPILEDTLEGRILPADWLAYKVRHLVHQGRIARETTGADEALPYLQQAAELTQLPEGASSEMASLRAYVLMDLGKCLYGAGHYDDAVSTSTEAYELYHALVLAEPEVFKWRKRIIYACIHAASAHMKYRDPFHDGTAIQLLNEAEDHLGTLDEAGFLAERVDFTSKIRHAINANRTIIERRQIAGGPD